MNALQKIILSTIPHYCTLRHFSFSKIKRRYLEFIPRLAASLLLFLASRITEGKVFEDTMDNLSNWTNVTGASPSLSSANGAFSMVPYLTLGNGVARAELPSTITGGWTLRFKASHSDWQRGLCASVLNADGTEGYGILWDSANSTQANGEGFISIRKFSLTSEAGWGDTGSLLTSPTDSGHGALSTPMAECELRWDAASGTLSARVDGVLVAQATDSSYSQFRRIYLRGNTTSYFDDVRLQTVFEEPMTSLTNWTTVTGSAPSLSSADSTLTEVPYLALNNGVARAELESTITGNWTLRFKASHSDWQRGLCASVLNADGTEGYGVLWDSANSTQANGEGFVSIRKFSLGSEAGWSDTGSLLTSPTDSGHGALSAPMAIIELSWDAATGTIYLRVDGMPVAQVTDSSYDSFSRVYLRGNTTSYFDDIVLLCDTPPSSAEISAAINIMSYGAVGDGVTDNQTAIENAITAAISQSKDLYVPPGVFSHSDNLLLNGASLLGHGYLSVLAGSDPANSSVRLSGSNVSIRKCRMISPNSTERLTTPQSSAIHLYGVSNFEVSGCYLEGTASTGVIASDVTSTNGVIYDNWVWDTYADGIHLTMGANNIELWNNRTRNTGDDMIAVVSYNNEATPCSDLWIVGNDLRGQPHGRGISCVGGEDVTIEGNFIQNSNGSGVHIVSESSYDTYGVDGVSVLDNLIVGAASYSAHSGIFLEGRSGYPVENILVDGNTILDSKSIGIRILNTTENVVVSNNRIISPQSSGIDCIGALKNITLSDNDISDTGQYAIFSYASSASGYLVIENNLFTDINVIGSETYVDVLLIEPGSTWGSVTITDNHYDNLGSYPIERYMEIHYPSVSQSSNTTSTSKPIWIGN